jgi:uncharacterized delta-60 repeat protein
MWTTPISLCLALSGKATPRLAARRRPTFHRPSCRPRLEALEDRRLLSAGALDTTFNPNGNPPGTVTTSLTSARDVAYVPLVQPDGKIVAAGTVLPKASGTSNWEFGVARYNADGSLDSSFGAGGTALAGFAHSAYGWAAVLYPNVGTANDGKIVVEGWTSESSKKGFSGEVLALARFNTNGTLDTTFGSGGEVTTAFPSVGSVTSRGVVITSTGKIVAVGDNGTDYVLARYNANESLDTTFDTGGDGHHGVHVADLRGKPGPATGRQAGRRR